MLGRVRGTYAGAPGTRQRGEQAVAVVYAELAQATSVGRRAQHRVGEVRTPERQPVRASLAQHGVVQLESELAQPLAHGLDAPRSVGPEARQRVAQPRIVRRSS